MYICSVNIAHRKTLQINNQKDSTMRLLRKILGGISLTAAMFVFQACYGTEPYCEQWGEYIFHVVDDKDGTLADQKVMDAVNACTAELGDTGRVLLRKSGTEPVLRVMSEAGSHEECEKYVDRIIESMKESGHLIEVKK